MNQYRVSRYTLSLDHEKVEADSPEQLELQLAAGEVTGELVNTEHVEVAQDFRTLRNMRDRRDPRRSARSDPPLRPAGTSDEGARRSTDVHGMKHPDRRFGVPTVLSCPDLKEVVDRTI